MTIGSAGAIHEEFYRAEASLPLLGFYLAVLGIPASQGLQWLFRSSTGESSSHSQPLDSSESSRQLNSTED